MSNPPKPTKLRLLDGGTERRNAVSHRRHEPTVEGIGEPRPNPWFSPEERKAFDHIIDHSPPGLLTRADEQCIERFCIAWARMKECDRLMLIEGFIVAGEDGMRRHPANIIRRDCVREIERCASLLGLSPLARMRLSGKLGDEQQDLIDALIEGWR